MLRELRVRDLAVIADVTLTLKPGLNVLTGETGAGKSILVDALSLLLGERASSDRVRPGAAQAVIEAAFDVEGVPGFAAAAEASGLEIEDGQFVVRRTLSAQGRNRVWANGSPTTVGVLSTLGRELVDLHGQHESQSLLHGGLQRDILDAYSGAEPAREAVRACFDRLGALQAEERQLLERRDDIRRRSDYLHHVVGEIEEVGPQPGEDETLAAEAQRLANAEELRRIAANLADSLDGDGEAAAVHVLGEAARLLEQLSRIDPQTGRWQEYLNTAMVAAEELGRELRSYESDLEVDPGRLEDLESRRDKIYRLLQKHGSTIEAVLETERTAREELELLDTAGFDLDRITEQIQSVTDELASRADDLTEVRRQGAKQLRADVDKLLPSLGLPDGAFLPQLDRLAEPGRDGAESVSFFVQLNPGLEARLLAQVASGGELSRIMLALKVVLAQQDAIPTLVFDEVDQGIGGEIGARVADALRRVAVHRQVLVITHLPQIAARGDHHLRVDKLLDKGVATTRTSQLDAEDRVLEVARMLGDSSDPSLRRHAKSLLSGSPEANVEPLPT